MSIELKINEKEELKTENQILEDNSSEKEESNEKNNKKSKIMEQKYKIDIIDAFGANTNDNNVDNPLNFISNNNYLIYNVGYHILIKDCPPNDDEILSEKEINKQSNSFFIYLSPYLKK